MQSLHWNRTLFNLCWDRYDHRGYRLTSRSYEPGHADVGARQQPLRPSRGDPRWRYVGIASGPQARYGTMCVMDFASSYQASVVYGDPTSQSLPLCEAGLIRLQAYVW